MEVLGIKCENCKEYFITKNETGEHICPMCFHKNERYVLSDEIGQKDVNIIMELYDKIINILDENNLKYSKIEVVEFIEKIILKSKGMN